MNLSREELARFLPSLRAIKAFEAFQRVVAETLPADIANNGTRIDSTETRITDLETLVQVLSASSASADRLSQAVESLTAQIAIARSDRTTINALQRQIDELRALLIGA